MSVAVAGGGAPEPVYDLVGVGFGPANLALAVALEERGQAGGGAVFLERRDRFAWHPGMLLEDATMQVSFLKDLATLRNPTSRYTFLSYLHERGRLVDFVNQKSFFPTRIEFHDYLEWAAARFHGAVRYGIEALETLPVTRDGRVEALDVIARSAGSGERLALRTRNLVVASGLRPRMPAGITASEHVWHSADLLDRVAGRAGRDPRVCAVVGAGQSAAEATAYLHGRFPDAEVYAVLPRYGYSPADDSPFANRVFDPGAVDDFFTAAPAIKETFFEYHANTNYSVVDIDLIEELYRRAYRESVRGRRRLRLLNLTRVVGARERPGGVVLRLERAGRTTALDTDIAVFATGYDQMDPAGLLGPVACLCKRDGRGLLRVGRDYRVETSGAVTAGIYLQGGTEHTHGISSSLLSNLADRAWTIAESITGPCPGPSAAGAAPAGRHLPGDADVRA